VRRKPFKASRGNRAPEAVQPGEAVRRKPCKGSRAPESGRQKPGAEESAGSRAPDAGRRMPGAGSRAPEAGRRKPGAGRRKPEARRRKPRAGRRAPGAGRRTPDAACVECRLGPSALLSCSKLTLSSGLLFKQLKATELVRAGPSRSVGSVRNKTAPVVDGDQ
jgi:hypothetical protein